MKKQQKQDKIIRETTSAVLGASCGFLGTYLVYWSFGGDRPLNVPFFILTTILLAIFVAAINYYNEYRNE